MSTDIIRSTNNPPTVRPRMVRTAVIVGTALEHYDYFLYGTAAALVFNVQFFVNDDPLVGTLAAFATFAAGFVARPFGALIFGHLGDTLGRRKTLIMTLLLIGVSTGLIGAIPNYGQIGVWAPIALVTLRLLQGISFGGEWAGAVTLAAEHAPKGREGAYASLPMLGSPIGNIVSTAAFLALGLMPADAFDSWAWRVPFLAAFPMLGLALWVRSQVDESPAFEKVAASKETKKIPAWEIIRRSPRQMFTGAALAFVGIGGFFVVTTFAMSYGTGTVGLSRTTMLTAVLGAALLQILTVLVTGRLADKTDPAKIADWSCAATALLAFPAVLVLSTGNPVLAILAVVVSVQPIAATYAVTGLILAELFSANVRYSGIAISYNIAGLIGGFIPLIATSLLLLSGSSAWPVALMLLVIALLSLAGAVTARKIIRT
ncbi:MFS transporter [Paenarthrobacter sp. NPDC090522]|uniref:MFS transporter n=1 Tax=Paenarthrobacter sp. NPDC090522 TaxID=3364383 RepID=UPI003826C3A6